MVYVGSRSGKASYFSIIGLVPFMFYTFHILYPKVFLIGIKDSCWSSDTLILFTFHCSSAHHLLSIPVHHSALNMLGPLLLLCAFLLFKSSIKVRRELLFKVWLAPGAALWGVRACLWYVCKLVRGHSGAGRAGTWGTLKCSDHVSGYRVKCWRYFAWMYV